MLNAWIARATPTNSGDAALIHVIAVVIPASNAAIASAYPNKVIGNVVSCWA